MSMFDTIKNLMKSADDEETTNNEVIEETEVIGRSKREYKEEPESKNRVVNIHATAQLQVVLVKPERFDDASSVADHLLSKRTVVLNLESTNKDVSRRLIDFLSGVAYANNGQIKRVANSTFIITPYDVNIMGDVLDELKMDRAIF